MRITYFVGNFTSDNATGFLLVGTKNGGCNLYITKFGNVVKVARDSDLQVSMNAYTLTVTGNPRCGWLFSSATPG